MLLATAAALAISCAGSSSLRYGDSVDVASYPPDIQAAYRVFAVRCSRCHTLSRPLNARISDPEHWVRYVTRMRRNQSSGINPKEAEIILSFLLYYTKQQAPSEAGAPELVEPTPTDELPAVVPVPPDPNMPAEPNAEPTSSAVDAAGANDRRNP